MILCKIMQNLFSFFGVPVSISYTVTFHHTPIRSIRH